MRKSQLGRIMWLLGLFYKTGMCCVALSCGEFTVYPLQPFCEHVYGVPAHGGRCHLKLNFLVLFCGWEQDIWLLSCLSAVWTFPNIMADVTKLSGKGVPYTGGDMVNEESIMVLMEQEDWEPDSPCLFVQGYGYSQQCSSRLRTERTLCIMQLPVMTLAYLPELVWRSESVGANCPSPFILCSY